MHGNNEIEVSQFIIERNEKIAKIEKQRELEKKEPDFHDLELTTLIYPGGYFKKAW